LVATRIARSAIERPRNNHTSAVRADSIASLDGIVAGRGTAVL
jgi:hypothetical protein